MRAKVTVTEIVSALSWCRDEAEYGAVKALAARLSVADQLSTVDAFIAARLRLRAPMRVAA